MIFADHLVLDAPTRATTSAGFMKVRAKAARVGHYEYTGRDVDPENKYGLRDAAIVKVAREPADVFDAASAHSFIGKPITDDHPSEAVTSTNWRDHARGTVMGVKWEEGGYLSFDLMLTDAAAISKVDAGKRELSNGYSCDLVHGDFVASDGVACQFKQTNIRGNHVALVDRGRAGPDCRIADAATCDTAPRSIFDSLTTQEKPVKTMLIDGLTVDLANAETAVATATALRDQRDAARTKLADADRELATKDAKIADLESKVSDQATIDALADAKADVVARGKEILGDKMPETKGKSVADVRRAVVLAAVSDSASLAGKSDDYIESRFDTLAAKDAKPLNNTVVSLGAPVNLGDGATIRDTIRNRRNAA